MDPLPRSQLISSLRRLNRKWRNHSESADPERAKESLASRLIEVVQHTWHLGLTSFGGPPVHFQIFHARFVEKEKWVDEPTYQELFAVCQGLPGPGSTKMLFCLVLLRAGFIPALLAFLLWSLPGAIGMYALSLGVQQIDEALPGPVYALLSGLNASTVGIIALAAVQLAEKAIRDKISRILVIFGACAGLCYSALWYFPVLMVVGGIATALWDGIVYQQIQRAKRAWRDRNRVPEPESDALESASQPSRPASTRSSAQTQGTETDMLRMRRPDAGSTSQPQPPEEREASRSQNHVVRVRVGLAIIILFFASFTAILVSRAKLQTPPLPLDLFANMYLAGTVIFGGGPVVIPLLRSYVVDPGWVSSRDFLIGLAIIQAFPGPNFNFAVFLGALALHSTSYPTIFGAFLGGLGIFFPGITLAVAVQSFWRVLRKQKAVITFLRGVNASAVGLVFTAVYRLWETGYLSPAERDGQSLAREPWWVVVAAVTYAESQWFGVPPALAILVGAVLGLLWFGVVRPEW